MFTCVHTGSSHVHTGSSRVHTGSSHVHTRSYMSSCLSLFLHCGLLPFCNLFFFFFCSLFPKSAIALICCLLNISLYALSFVPNCTIKFLDICLSPYGSHHMAISCLISLYSHKLLRVTTEAMLQWQHAYSSPHLIRFSF